MLNPLEFSEFLNQTWPRLKTQTVFVQTGFIVLLCNILIFPKKFANVSSREWKKEMLDNVTLCMITEDECLETLLYREFTAPTTQNPNTPQCTVE